MRTTNWDMTPAQLSTYKYALDRGLLSGQCLTLPGQWIANVEPQTSGCWHWVRNTSPYGQFLNRGRRYSAHRTAYELLIGPIPPGLHIDHLCRNPQCVNPTHLEPVTPSENNRRSESRTARNIRKTHCLRGHVFDGANTWTGKDGSRHCRACLRIRAAVYRDIESIVP